MLRRCLVVVLVCLLGAAVGLSTCGAGGYRGGYAGGGYTRQGAGYASSGGASAKKDTIYVLFTLQDVLTNNSNPASIDTSLVAKASVTPVQLDGNRRQLFTQRLALCDSAHILGTGGKVTSFAYASIDTADRDGYQPAQAYVSAIGAPVRLGSNPYYGNRNYPTTGRKTELVYIPFEKYIPAHSTIISATLNWSDQSGGSISASDSLYVTLDSRATDNKWYTTKSVGTTTPYPNYARTGWANQISSNSGVGGWGSTDSNPWVPALRRRPYIRTWGAVVDSQSIGTVTLKTGHDYSIKACVQAAVSGAINNGLVLNFVQKSSATAVTYQHYCWDEVSNAIGRTPYVYIKYTKDRYNGSLDVTPPSAPSGFSAMAGNKSVSTSWGQSQTGGDTFKLYRYYDGSPDTTLVWTGAETAAIDNGAINGSPASYFVTASDASGNESADSSHLRVWPGTIKMLQRPAYFSVWFQDPVAAWTDAEVSARVDSLSKFDCVIGGPFPFEGNTLEPFYTNLVTKLRVKNPNLVYLTYIHPWQMPWDAGLLPTTHPYYKMYQYAAKNDSANFALDLNYHVARGREYPGASIMNYMVPANADTVARYWVESFVRQADPSVRSEYTGFFVDDFTKDLQYYSFWKDSHNHALGYGAVEDVVMGDVDLAYSDAEGNAPDYWDLYMLAFVKALRREIAKAGLQNIIIIPNSDIGRAGNAGITTLDSQIMELVDGYMNEGWNRWNPGVASPNSDNVGASAQQWADELAMTEQFTHSQIAPTPGFFLTHVNEELVGMSTALSMWNDSWVCASDIHDRYHSNLRVAPPPTRTIDPGTFISSSFKDGGSNADTLVSSWSNAYSKLVTRHNALNATDEFAVWPFAVFAANGDTILRSQYWPRKNAPVDAPSPWVVVNGGDNIVEVNFGFVTGPGNLSRFDIYRSTQESVFKTIDPSEYMISPNYWKWVDHTVKNDSTEYCYTVKSVISTGSVSAASAAACVTPHDGTPPAAPTLAAYGLSSGIFMHISGVMPTDFVRFRIFANYGAGFARIDSTGYRDYTDTNAPSGLACKYYVKSVDDDGLSSAPSDTAVAMWWSDPAAGAPTNLIASTNTTHLGYTDLSWTAPTTTTGLEGYIIKRGTSILEMLVYKTRTTLATSYTDSAATAGTMFVYRVYPIYSGVTGTGSNATIHTNPTEFLPATPQLSGGGAATGIQLTWTPIVGSAKYQVFRGATYSDVQSSTTPIAETTGTSYLDTGATASTMYNYAVRAVSASGLKSLPSNVIWTSWTPSDCTGIEIKSVTGTVSNGSSVVIAGCGFGAKSPAAPLLWDNFDSYTTGGMLPPPWTYNVGERTGRDYGKISASDKYGSTGKSLVGEWLNHDDWTTDSMYMYQIGETGVSQSTVYYSYNFRIVYLTNGVAATGNTRPPGVVKLGRVNGWPNAYDGDGDLTFSNNMITWSDGATAYEWWVADEPSSFDFYAWHRMEMYRSMPSLPATTDQYGTLWWMRDAQYIPMSSSAPVTTSYVTNGSVRKAGQVWSADHINTPTMWTNVFAPDGLGVAGVNEARIYCDNIYVDNTMARVELGNSATFSACTHREVQIPSAWSPTSVTVTLNTGTFANGTAYLFVVDKDGVASAGKAVTITTALKTLSPASSSLIVGGHSFRVYLTTWPDGTSGSITVRAVDTITGNVVDEDTSTAGSSTTGPILTGLNPGEQYRIEYKTSTSSDGYQGRTEWTTMFGPYTQPARDGEISPTVEFN